MSCRDQQKREDEANKVSPVFLICVTNYHTQWSVFVVTH